MTTTATPQATLPRIIRFVGVHDSGEFGNATCPHCGADGRYVWTFITEDGVQRGAMAGCIQKFPVSKLADEHKRIIDRQRQRQAKGQSLASWDVRKLSAIAAVEAGTMDIATALVVIQSENVKRSEWMRKRGRR